MNIFSNLGITELVLIFLLALLVVGPERLPELGRKLGTTLRDLRKAYDNLTRDLGPELASFQETAKELRESVDSVRSIPQDMVQQVVKSAELDETLDELKGVRDTVGQMGQTLTHAQKMVSNPLNAAVNTARGALSPDKAVAEESGAAVGVKETVSVEPAKPAETAGKAVADAEPQDETLSGAAAIAMAEEGIPPSEVATGAGAVADAQLTINTTEGTEQPEEERPEADGKNPPEHDDD